MSALFENLAAGRVCRRGWNGSCSHSKGHRVPRLPSFVGWLTSIWCSTTVFQSTSLDENEKFIQRANEQKEG